MEEVYEFRVVNSVLIAETIFSSLINITLIKIHMKQPLLKDGFFHVVFGQIIIELLINISMFLLNLIYLVTYDDEHKNGPGKWFIIIPAIFNYSYVAYIIYNIQIIHFLMHYNKDKEELINYAMKDNGRMESDDMSKRSSIYVVSPTFNNFHILSCIISVIHTILFLVNLLVFQHVEVQSKEWNWYYYIIHGQDYFYRIFFFIPHFVFFIISSIYFIKSLDKNKISNHIYLQSYSNYCFFSSFISLFFPGILLFFWLGADNKNNNLNQYYLIIPISGFFAFLLATTIFRLRNYYVAYLLTENGKGWKKGFKNIFGILFCGKKMIELNFVDLNSVFIYHSLANYNDFILDESEDDDKTIPLAESSGKEVFDNLITNKL